MNQSIEPTCGAENFNAGPFKYSLIFDTLQKKIHAIISGTTVFRVILDNRSKKKNRRSRRAECKSQDATAVVGLAVATARALGENFMDLPPEGCVYLSLAARARGCFCVSGPTGRTSGPGLHAEQSYAG